jgi:hypothetical protein
MALQINSEDLFGVFSDNIQARLMMRLQNKNTTFTTFCAEGTAKTVSVN